jgi:hypothetical protein
MGMERGSREQSVNGFGLSGKKAMVGREREEDVYKSYGLLVSFYSLFLSHYLSLSYYLYLPISLHTFSHPREYNRCTELSRQITM